MCPAVQCVDAILSQDHQGQGVTRCWRIGSLSVAPPRCQQHVDHLRWNSLVKETSPDSSHATRGSRWSTTSGCCWWCGPIRRSGEFGRIRGCAMTSWSRRENQGWAGHRGVTRTRDGTCCLSSFARQRPIRQNGGNAYPCRSRQSWAKASVATASGSGLQLKYRRSWWFVRLANRSVWLGRNTSWRAENTLGCSCQSLESLKWRDSKSAATFIAPGKYSAWRIRRRAMHHSHSWRAPHRCLCKQWLTQEPWLC